MAWFSKTSGYDSNTDHLRDELHRIAGFVRAQLLRLRAAFPESERERFWHVPDSRLEALGRDEDHSPLQAFEPPPEVAEILLWVTERGTDIDRRVAATRKVDLRFVRLCREYELNATERDALLLAWLPILHSTYRHWYGLLQHDAAKVLASVGLLTEMLAGPGDDYQRVLAALSPAGTLALNRLIVLGGGDEDPATLRSVSIDDRVSGFLIGNDFVDTRIAAFVRWFDEHVDLRTLPVPAETANRLEMLPNLRAADPDFLRGLRLEFLGPDPGLAVRTFGVVAAGVNRGVLVIDAAAALAGGAPWPLVVDCALREARLGVGLPIFTGVAALYDQGESSARADHLLARLANFPHPAAIDASAASGQEGRTLPGWIPFRFGVPTVAMREALWQELINKEGRIEDPAGVAHSLAVAFQLTDSQIRDAWRTAEGLARRRNVFILSLQPADLFEACRRQSSRRLISFATRIEPRPNLRLESDLILPPANRRALYELRARIRNHPRVHGLMGLGEHMRLGRGVTALFVGGSGTGKTLAAEVLASEQQIDLYKIDLAALVSKWVGETEKNLSRIFTDAERANCMLFFDEADAIFGRRGEIKEAHDRWANLEVNYLLQRIEDYSGVVVLATNLKQNIDDAFQRRIHVMVEFPAPNPELRRDIWRRLLPEALRASLSEADISDVAQRFELTGGNIRNIVLDACYRTVEGEGQDQARTIRHLVASTAREYQKMSRPVTPGDFGRFYDWAIEDVISPARAVARSGG